MRPASILLPFEELQTHWQCLNARYFAGSLPPISIRWSRRLTSSVGMFASRGGPKAWDPAGSRNRREIRLSHPLFERLAERTSYAKQELLNTLAHEMIHQWQFDVLKRRPDHGLEFLRKMTEVNRSGDVAVTTHHTLEKEVLALSRFAWRCKDCGRVYRRQRNSIQPTQHHCGACRGSLEELMSPARSIEHRLLPSLARISDTMHPSARPGGLVKAPEQLTLELA